MNSFLLTVPKDDGYGNTLTVDAIREALRDHGWDVGVSDLSEEVGES